VTYTIRKQIKLIGVAPVGYQSFRKRDDMQQDKKCEVKWSNKLCAEINPVFLPAVFGTKV